MADCKGGTCCCVTDQQLSHPGEENAPAGEERGPGADQKEDDSAERQTLENCPKSRDEEERRNREDCPKREQKK